MSNLVLIPLTLAGYARYLKGIKDDGTAFEPSPDPMLAEMQAIVAPLEIGEADQDWSPLKQLYSDGLARKTRSHLPCSSKSV